MIKCIFFWIAAFASTALSQTVSTLAGPLAAVSDELALDAEGNIFAADNSGGLGFPNGRTVVKITSTGSASPFATLDGAPTGLAFDKAGNLYASNWTRNLINKITPEGDVSIFTTGISRPGGLVFDASGDTLYAAHSGGNAVCKIDPAGKITTIASGGGLSAPAGVTFDEAGNLYVANFNNGQIFVLPPNGVLTPFVTLPVNNIGHLDFAANHLYATGFSDHRVYKIDLSGEFSVFAGTGAAGGSNGAADAASFNGPNGVAATASGDTIYVADFNSMSLRRIISGTTTGLSLAENFSPTDFSLEQNYPNPFNPRTTIAFHLFTKRRIRLSVYDIYGRTVRTLLDASMNPGNHSVVWDGETSDGKSASSGVYFYALEIDGTARALRRMVLLR